MRTAARLATTAAMAVVAFAGAIDSAVAQEPCPCQLPDNGAGTVTMPPNCLDGYRGDLEIVNGLTNATIEIDATLFDVGNVLEIIGGGLGGTQSTFDAMLLLEMSGTGNLGGFSRMLHMPVSGVAEWGPRVLNDAVQPYAGELVELEGDILNDPDFDLLQFRTGSDLSLPASGTTTLTRLGGPGTDFQVDSFFDLSYQIEFVGALGSVLQDQVGTTTGRDATLQVCWSASIVEGTTWGTIKALYR
jgi:hypothetical protein